MVRCGPRCCARHKGAIREDISVRRKENRTMEKKSRFYVVSGMVLPWITLILLIGVSTYYCDLLWLRIVCSLVAIWNGSVMLRLVREVSGKSQEKTEENA